MNIDTNLPWHVYRQSNNGRWVVYKTFASRGDAEVYFSFMKKYVPNFKLEIVSPVVKATVDC